MKGKARPDERLAYAAEFLCLLAVLFLAMQVAGLFFLVVVVAPVLARFR